ncbi:hypothetical protein L198_07287 [Cryptococcus wingfieldii CBS 7118]|uniref:Uncharacterized protein n=1 Tax=Cryptococcus wingfieldii CBS 7118 TaxID=1295528 RepID=A0A1E3ID94_9TREE|nr:hypothetical protein L198_07287 [Cryptococcus wingfieldii CBS 7118]ODN86592.1 hypothetical protein L198_07287 [Cryptococcus wingfieldii CBS 7118]
MSPSASPSASPEPAASSSTTAAAAPAPKVSQYQQGRKQQAKENGGRRRAGGPGKKGKVFVEDKKDLLSLISSISGEAEALSTSRISKVKDVQQEKAVQQFKRNQDVGAAGGKTLSGAERKKRARAKELKEAKTKVLEKEKAKKDRKAGKQTPADGKPAKKSVGFA